MGEGRQIGETLVKKGHVCWHYPVAYTNTVPDRSWGRKGKKKKKESLELLILLSREEAESQQKQHVVIKRRGGGHENGKILPRRAPIFP